MINQFAPLFPLSFPLHIGFIVVSLIIFGVHYKIRPRKYQLLFVIGILATLLIYLDQSIVFMIALGVVEIAIFILGAINMHKYNKERENEGEVKKNEDSNS